MLALKSMRVSALEFGGCHKPAVQIQSLPQEILDLIVEWLYAGGDCQLDAILPLSRVSRSLRQAALPLLFEKLSCIVRDKPWQRQRRLLANLLSRPHLLSFVRTLRLLPSTNLELMEDDEPAQRGEEPSSTVNDRRPCKLGNSIDIVLLQRCLARMPRLSTVRFDCSLEVVVGVLKILPPAQCINLIVDQSVGPAHANTFLEFTRLISELGPHQELSYGVLTGQPLANSDLVPLGRYLDRLSSTKAIALDASWLQKRSMNPIEFAFESPFSKRDLAWEELWIVWTQDSRLRIGEFDLDVVPWSKLQRLSIFWETTDSLSQFIRSVATELTGLKALRLRTDVSQQYHPECKRATRHRRIQPDDIQVLTWPPFEVNFSRLKQLQELEIDGICNHVPITRLVGPNLRALRLHCEDREWSVCNLDSQRTPTEITLAAKIAPNIEKLELDVGFIQNLWHPTAIPGVDVDNEQYLFLNAITKFRRLRSLRLYPPFVPRHSRRHTYNVPYCLPVSDDQAVRIFNYLRAGCPSLQSMSIAAVPTFDKPDTMCWDVKTLGAKTILTTKHRNRNYEHRQTWLGQRRMSTEIKRDKNQDYLSDMEGWKLNRKWPDAERAGVFA